jgi:5-methylcytosine-specific restriction endonuclease McrA
MTRGYLVGVYCIVVSVYNNNNYNNNNMKKIDIIGKRNQDKMKQMADPEAVIERKVPKNRGGTGLTDNVYDTDQSLVLEVLKASVADKSLGVSPAPSPASSASAPVLAYVIREIDTKRKAYIYQDKHHEIYDPRYTVTTDRIVELLVGAELLCHYCREICQVAYKEAMCRRQWTLDRIDNNYGHNDTNVVIACLDCNLKRGTMDAERFRQGKQFTFRKVE